MNPNSAVAKEVKNMANFISEREKELSSCMMLLHVQSAVRKLKGEDFGVDIGLIDSIEAAIQQCKQVLNELLNDPESGGDYIARFKEKENIVVSLIEDLKKKTNFYRSKIIYSDDFFEALEKATTKFIETAD